MKNIKLYEFLSNFESYEIDPFGEEDWEDKNIVSYIGYIKVRILVDIDRIINFIDYIYDNDDFELMYSKTIKFNQGDILWLDVFDQDEYYIYFNIELVNEYYVGSGILPKNVFEIIEI